MATAAKNSVESFREVVQDLLVPELKAVKASVDSLRSETKTSIDALRSEMTLRDEKLELTIRLSIENATQAVRHLAERLDDSIEIKQRLASLEARMPRQ
ncbi:MAG TPA: hypothetical protein VN612_11445 [Acidobacteriaceae bacterium]|nr:hypothetical protein [Acidobacteriaceae bacterium]